MRISFIILIVIMILKSAWSQDAKEYSNPVFLKKLYNEKSYSDLKRKITQEFKNVKAGRWGEFVDGVVDKFITQKKLIAFTFDACGGRNGNGYDKELIDYLRKEKIPSTLFVTGKWIDAQFEHFLDLSRDSLFEIENHGLNHKPCSVQGDSIYGIHGTRNIEEAFDEVEANARKIESITKHYPHFYRSATAFIDEAGAAMAAKLDITPISYEILSGDATPLVAESKIVENVLKNIKPGAIVIMHFNHPERNTKEAMEKIIPELRKMGYSFVRLKDFNLTSLNGKIITKKKKLLFDIH
jgi:peptidoglycan/xylan/chitin deacetylase (PgdA/CDA1 family)